MPAYPRFLFISVSLIAFAPAALAEDVVTTAPEIVVSATGEATPAGQVASSVSVISRQDIEAMQKPDLISLLDAVPGITVAKNGASGQTANVFIRGTNTGHTKVIVDGVTVNDPSNTTDFYDFNYLSADNIERIEVLRGPESTLYGSDAIGGVIVVTTRQGMGAPHAFASAEAGSFNTKKYSAGSAGEMGRFNYALDLARMDTGGISSFSRKLGGRENDPTTNNTFSGNMKAKLTDNFSASLVGRYTEGTAHFDGFGTDSLQDRTHTTRYDARAAGNLSLYGGAWTQELGLSTYHTWSEFFQDDAFTPAYSKDLGSRNRADWTNRIKVIPDHTFTVGLQAEEESFTSNTTREVSTHTRSAMLQDQFQLGKSFFAAIGGRVDNHSTFGTVGTWRIAPAYIIEETGTKLKATVGTGFKAPSLFQLFSPSYGTRGLNPERSRGEDVGFEQRLWGDRVTFGSTAFWNQIRDLIDFNFSTFRYFNVKQAHTRGYENFISYRPAADITLRFNHTYLQTDDSTTHAQLLRRPKNQFSASADYSFMQGRGNAQLFVHGLGSRQDIDLNFNRVSNPSFYTVDVSASYQLVDHVKAFGRIENLFDRQYMTVYGYGMPGFGSFAGLKIDY